MTKIMFDINKSLAECPPEIYYSQLGTDGEPLFPGIRFVKRLVLNRNRETGVVTFRSEDQIREEELVRQLHSLVRLSLQFGQ